MCVGAVGGGGGGGAKGGGGDWGGGGEGCTRARVHACLGAFGRAGVRAHVYTLTCGRMSARVSVRDCVCRGCACRARGARAAACVCAHTRFQIARGGWGGEEGGGGRS